MGRPPKAVEIPVAKDIEEQFKDAPEGSPEYFHKKKLLKLEKQNKNIFKTVAETYQLNGNKLCKVVTKANGNKLSKFVGMVTDPKTKALIQKLKEKGLLI